MIQYKLHNDLNGNARSVELVDNDGKCYAIPFDPANTDYQQYLAWLADGNEPLPADEVTQ